MQTVRYRGKSDLRIITDASFTAAGLSSPTVTWQKSNGFEVVLDDPVAAFALAQGDFELGDPNTKFGDMFDVPIVADWRRDTLTSPVTWQEQLYTVDGVQDINWSVVNGRLRFSGAALNLGNCRTVLLHPLTNYQSCSVKSLWWGPNEFNVNPTRRPQMGHIHRFVDLGPGLRKRGIAVWYNIFLGPNPHVLNVAVWETDGTTLFMSDIPTAGSLAQTVRSARIQYANRFSFGGTLIQMNGVPNHSAMALPQNGIVGRLTGMTQAGLDTPATQAVTAAVRTAGVSTLTYGAAHGRAVGEWLVVDLNNNTYDGLHQITEVPTSTTLRFAQTGVADAGTATGTTLWMYVTNGGEASTNLIQVIAAGANLEDKVGGGVWTPEYPWLVLPYWVKSWVVDMAGVANVFVKQWAYGMPEPDDGDANFVDGPIPITNELGTATGIPVGVPGLHGVIGAHSHSNNYGEYGPIEFRRMRAA